jgi:hypothetical protein
VVYVLGIKPDGNKSLLKFLIKRIPHPSKILSYSEDNDKYEYSYLNNVALNYTYPE